MSLEKLRNSRRISARSRIPSVLLGRSSQSRGLISHVSSVLAKGNVEVDLGACRSHVIRRVVGSEPGFPFRGSWSPDRIDFALDEGATSGYSNHP